MPGTVTSQNIAAFKRAYNNAKKLGKVSFFFEKTEIVTECAKYVIEYYNSRTKNLKPKGVSEWRKS